MSKDSKDLIIIGAGPAGLSAGIYASREGMSTLLLEGLRCGGQLASADMIENYPGFPKGISGMKLADAFKEQAKRFGTEIIEFQNVGALVPEADAIQIKTGDHQYRSRAVIVASGASPQKLDIPGEKEFTGKGVSYCATCDGPLFKGKDVVVIGGGNTALEEALFLSRFARKVTLIHRRFEFRAARILQDRLSKQENVQALLNHKPVSISGSKTVDSITVQDNASGEQSHIKVHGIFVYIGSSPNSGFLCGLVDMDEAGYIKTDEQMRTTREGIYAAGDIRSKSVRQVDVACSEGTIAAISIRDYLKEKG